MFEIVFAWEAEFSVLLVLPLLIWTPPLQGRIKRYGMKREHRTLLITQKKVRRERHA
jgi:hypothetical protein